MKCSDLFTLMEDNHGFDPDDEVHIYALHVVFTTKKQLRLAEWRNQHDNHNTRTVKGLDPEAGGDKTWLTQN